MALPASRQPITRECRRGFRKGQCILSNVGRPVIATANPAGADDVGPTADTPWEAGVDAVNCAMDAEQGEEAVKQHHAVTGRRGGGGVRWQAAVLLALAGGALSGCPKDPVGPDYYLIVNVASDQPESAALGTLVVVQAKGVEQGGRLRIRTLGGTHRDATDERPRHESCDALARGKETHYFVVQPEDVEAWFFVELLAPGEASDPEALGDGGSGAVPPGLLAACPGAPLADAVKAITVIRTNSSQGGVDGGPQGGSAGAGGHGGAADGGAAGAAGQTGGTGGAA